MVETKFTKGPWQYCDAYHETQVDIRDAGRRRIAVVVSDYPMTCGTMEANAHLIATAPDMYAALEAAINWRGLDGDGISDPVREQLYAALSKARGEK